MAEKKKNLRLNCVSVGTEAVFHVLIGLFSVCCIIPFIFVIIISFSSKESITTIGYSFIPTSWSMDAYQYAFNKLPQIWRSYFNSIYITVIGTVLSTTMCAMYAYVLYRPDFKFRSFFNFLSFFTMIFGGGLVPTYIVSKQLLGLSENYAALIVPLLVSPFNIIVMRSFFKSSVPLELIEAATIDGSGEYSTLFRVVVPIAKPGIATIAFKMFGSTGAAIIILIGGICCIACMNDMVTPSISLEGRSIWILQSLPVSPYMVLAAKLKVQIVLTLVPVVLCLFAIAATVPCNAIQFILGSAFAMLNVNLMALFGIFLGLKMPNLTWTSELIPIKQSFSVMIALIGGFLFNAAFVGLYFLVGRKVGEVIYLCLAILVTAVLGFVLNSWLKNKGSRIFAEL